MTAAVEVHDLRFAYGEREVLRGVTFAVEAGEVFGLLGPNGGGKTTLFRTLTTLLPPMGGRGSIFGADLAAEADRVRREIGVVFQAASLDRKLTVRENLTHQGHLFGLRGRALGERIADLLRRFGLAERADDLAETLSGGLRRRVELAKGLLHGPRLLILDEPTAGLDPGARRDFWAELQRLREEGAASGHRRPGEAATPSEARGPAAGRLEGTTVLFTTHLMEEADRCDRVAILDRGTVVAIGTPDALKGAVGGDVVTVRAADAAGLKADIEARLGVEATVLDGQIRIERAGGRELVPRIAEAFGARVESITLGRPTLEDVFIHQTGHRFAA